MHPIQDAGYWRYEAGKKEYLLLVSCLWPLVSCFLFSRCLMLYSHA